MPKLPIQRIGHFCMLFLCVSCFWLSFFPPALVVCHENGPNPSSDQSPKQMELGGSVRAFQTWAHTIDGATSWEALRQWAKRTAGTLNSRNGYSASPPTTSHGNKIPSGVQLVFYLQQGNHTLELTRVNQSQHQTRFT